MVTHYDLLQGIEVVAFTKFGGAPTTEAIAFLVDQVLSWSCVNAYGDGI